MARGALARRRELREAYDAHAAHLYDLAVRSLDDDDLAEQAVQETFLRAWKAWDRLPPGTGGRRSQLLAILRDVVVDLAPAGAVEPGGVEATAERLEQSLLGRQVEEAMRRLGLQHRQVLVETYYRGRTYAEVGIELGLPEETVKHRVYDSLRALKVALEEVTSEGGEVRKFC